MFLENLTVDWVELEIFIKYLSNALAMSLGLVNQRSKFTLAVSKCWGFCWGISMFFSICLGNQSAKVIKFLEILKKYVSKNKIYFCLRKKRNVPLNKKVYFVIHTIFKLDFIMQIIYCIPQMSVFSSHTFLFFYVSF